MVSELIGTADNLLSLFYDAALSPLVETATNSIYCKL